MLSTFIYYLGELLGAMPSLPPVSTGLYNKTTNLVFMLSQIPGTPERTVECRTGDELQAPTGGSLIALQARPLDCKKVPF